MKLSLLARVAKNRDVLGTIEAWDQDTGEVLLDRAPALARSDSAKAASVGNSSRDPLKRYGDLPTGLYRAIVAEPGVPARTYGTSKRLLLVPQKGQAKKAAEEYGRSSLMVHAGALNPAYKRWAGLRPTYGCLRVSEETMAAILKLLEKATGPVYLIVDEVPADALALAA
jgi:hypothetical protein